VPAGVPTVDAEGSVDLRTKAVAARAHVVAADLAYDALAVRSATVVASSSGTLDRPVVDVGVHAGGVVAGRRRAELVEMRGRIETGTVTTIRDAHVDVIEGGCSVSLFARRVQIGGPRIVVDGAVVTGLGERLLADFSRDENELRLMVEAPSIDLARVASLAGAKAAVKSGHASFHGDVTLRRSGGTGELRARIHSLSTAKVEAASLDLRARLAVTQDGTSLTVGATGDLGGADRFEIAAENVVVGGSPIEAASWRHAYGRARFRANLAAAKLWALLPKVLLPIGDVTGQLFVAGALGRESPNAAPEVRVHAQTRDLAVAGARRGVGASLDVQVDPTSGFSEVAFDAFDRHGVLLSADAKGEVPYARIIAARADARALLESAPFRARLVIPRRALGDLAQLFGPNALPGTLAGTLDAEIEVAGTALHPQATLAARARDVRAPSMPANLASDASVTLRYDGERAELVATSWTGDHLVLDANALLDLRARDFVGATSDRPGAWVASGRMKLASFPMEMLEAVSEVRVRGHLSGEVVVDGLHENARVDAHAILNDVAIDGEPSGTLEIGVVAADEKLTATARIQQPDGFAELEADAGVAWGASLVPAVDRRSGVRAHLRAKGFHAATLLPLLRSQLNALDGRLDADAALTIAPGAEKPAVEGKIVLRDGTLQAAAFRDEYRRARATATFLPDGKIRIDDVYMSGGGGELTADGVVELRGMALESLVANVHVPKDKGLELAPQGQVVGTVSGDVKVQASHAADDKTLKVVVDVPTLNAVLPRRIRSGAQELSRNEKIQVGIFHGRDNLVKVALDQRDVKPPKTEERATTAIDVDLRLSDVTIAQGNLLRIVLKGNPHITVSDKVHVTGQVEVAQGRLEIQGKKFEIEKGTITFNPQDASNPTVIATAEWTADDGSRVYADFAGPVKSGKLTLRSDPPRPRNEVLTLILFGTADGANAVPPPGNRGADGSTKAAVGIGGAFAARGLTKAMDDLTGIQATAKVDTTRSENPAPEIEVQLARRLSIAFAHVLGTPPLSEPDKNLATIFWRVGGNWSVAATVGDAGRVQTDAVWQRRY